MRNAMRLAGQRSRSLRDNDPDTRVVLVRHAESVVAEGTPPTQQPLTDQGRHDSTLVGGRLFNGSTATAVWTSPQRKACETAAFGFPSFVAHVRKRLREVIRPRYAQPDQVARAAAAYLTGEVANGWERLDDVVARLTSLATDFAPWGRVIVVSHGTRLTVGLDHAIRPRDPFSFWSNLRVPDAWELNLEEWSVARIV